MGFHACAFANHQNISFAEELTGRGRSPDVGPSTPIAFALLRGNISLEKHIIAHWPEQVEVNVKGFSVHHRYSL